MKYGNDISGVTTWHNLSEVDRESTSSSPMYVRWHSVHGVSHDGYISDVSIRISSSLNYWGMPAFHIVDKNNAL